MKRGQVLWLTATAPAAGEPVGAQLFEGLI